MFFFRTFGILTLLYYLRENIIILTIMNKQKTELIDLLTDVEDYLLNDLEAICDEEYMEEANNLLKRVQLTIENIRSESQ